MRVHLNQSKRLKHSEYLTFLILSQMNTLAKIKATPLAQLVGLKVRVYRNLHNGKFSVMHKGLVIAHLDEVALESVTFTVQPAGRARVVATRTKTVHAFVNGTVIAASGAEQLESVKYNPFKAGNFYAAATGEAIVSAAAAHLRAGSVFV